MRQTLTLNYLLQGGPRKWQLNIIDIFNVLDLLTQRGFEEVSENSIGETLIGIFQDGGSSWDSKRREFMTKFVDKAFRTQIRDMIFGVTNELPGIEFTYEASMRNQQLYSNTVELLMAYLCVRELQALSASFGVRIKNAPHGGDFDCIANFQNSLLHFEIKSGNVKNINEETLQCFLDRHSFLAPDASVLFLDYQGQGKSSFDNLILRFKNLKIGSLRKVTKINKIEEGSNRFYTLDGDLIVFDLHKNGNILSNLRSAMQYFHRYNSFSKTMNYLLIEPENLGYKPVIINHD